LAVFFALFAVKVDFSAFEHTACQLFVAFFFNFNFFPIGFGAFVVNIFKTITFYKSFLTNFGNAIGNGYAGKSLAPIERLISNFSNAIGESYAGKVTAIAESQVINRGNAIGNGDAGEVSAKIESQAANRSNPIRNSNFGKAIATRESPRVNNSSIVVYSVCVALGADYL
jgi:hypothetical protein